MFCIPTIQYLKLLFYLSSIILWNLVVLSITHKYFELKLLIIETKG